MSTKLYRLTLWKNQKLVNGIQISLSVANNSQNVVKPLNWFYEKCNFYGLELSNQSF